MALAKAKRMALATAQGLVMVWSLLVVLGLEMLEEQDDDLR